MGRQRNEATERGKGFLKKKENEDEKEKKKSKKKQARKKIKMVGK